MRNVFPLAGLLMLACAGVPLSAADFQGAAAAMKKIAESRQEIPDATQKANSPEALRQQLAEYRRRAPTLPPGQAATEWVALFDRVNALSIEAFNSPGGFLPGDNRLPLRQLLEELPPVNAWDPLLAKLDARQTGNAARDNALHLLVAFLRGDHAGQLRLMDELQKQAAGPSQKPWLMMAVDLLRSYYGMFGDRATRLDSFEKRLAQAEAPVDGNIRDTLELPTLVRLAGPEKAEALLRRALVLDVNIQVSDEETRRLAARLALQLIDKLKRPQWALIKDLDDVPLYEAMRKQVPKAESQDTRNRREALEVYVASLLMDNRVKEAAEFALRSRTVLEYGGSLLNVPATNALLNKGKARPLAEFLHELLSQEPTLPYWTDYIQLSAQIGESDKALALLREIADRPNLPALTKNEARRNYINALLAADKMEEGVKALRETIKEGSAIRATTKVDAEVYAQIDYGLHLARLGVMLKRNEWVDEGIAAALAEFEKSNLSMRWNAMETILDFLVWAGRGPEAEKLLTETSLTMAGKLGPEDYWPGQRIQKLAVIYHLAGRYQDVLQLIEQSPYWGAADFAGLAKAEQYRVPVLYAVAKALAVAGRKAEALRVVNRLLETHGGYDPGYALFLELGGEEREARLDALAKANRFEERPLIWKATLQFRAGHLDEAEKTVRAAIAIDPSDGDEGKGDRLRAYAVLGDILEKKGDAAQAQLMRGAVEAIRLSENADDWWYAGLLRRAAKMYENALGRFADAYCIQSRLALRYSELGDLAKAEEHYQRAFELMPESFGHMESHCFGCEGIFTQREAQQVAERVFARLASAPGARPQVFYLLGYLREGQHRDAEAVEQYRQAVKLDPDYFNAWVHLAGIAGSVGADADEEAATLALLRLDPTMEHHDLILGSTPDPRKLWEAILVAEKSRPRVSAGSIFPLPQAVAEMARHEKVKKEIEQLGYQSGDLPTRRRNLRETFVDQPLLSAITSLLEQVEHLPRDQ